MSLYLIGIGLGDENDLTLRSIDVLKKCNKVFIDNYTAIPMFSLEKLEAKIGKKIILANRDMIEKSPDEILNDNVALLVVGDPFSATTHHDLFLRAKEKDLDIKVIHNVSILTAISDTGLQLYKFGKTTSIVFPEKDWMPKTPYETIEMNKKNGLHTIALLDIKVKEPSKENLKKGIEIFEDSRFMTIDQGIRYLLEMDNGKGVFTKDTLCIGCARLGTPTQKILCGTANELLEVDFGKPMHTLVIPGDLHFIEQDMLNLWKIRSKNPNHH